MHSLAFSPILFPRNNARAQALNQYIFFWGHDRLDLFGSSRSAIQEYILSLSFLGSTWFDFLSTPSRPFLHCWLQCFGRGEAGERG